MNLLLLSMKGFRSFMYCELISALVVLLNNSQFFCFLKSLNDQPTPQPRALYFFFFPFFFPPFFFFFFFVPPGL